MKDEIFKEPIKKQFEFDKSVASVFDDMISRSVPFYKESSELICERWKGLDLYFHQDCRTRGFRSGCVHLLPPYDEYLIGYKSRHVALHPDHSHRAHNNSGIFWPVVLKDGEVVGNWNAASGKVSVSIFHPDANIDEDALLKETERFNSFLKAGKE